MRHHLSVVNSSISLHAANGGSADSKQFDQQSNSQNQTDLPIGWGAAPVPPVECYLSEHTEEDKDKLKSVGGAPCAVWTLLVLSAVVGGLSALAPDAVTTSEGQLELGVAQHLLKSAWLQTTST